MLAKPGAGLGSAWCCCWPICCACAWACCMPAAACMAASVVGGMKMCWLVKVCVLMPPTRLPGMVGCIGGAIHLNDAQTRIATYSQWNQRGDYQAMLRSTEMRRRNREIHDMCKSFEPVMYEVQAVFGR